jgi:hypothetical protein
LDGGVWSINDTDFIQCRWENSSGYTATDQSIGSFQWICQNADGAVQYIACKVHGASPIQGQFAADGQCIIDNAFGLDLTSIDFTHFSSAEKGSVRMMGANMQVRLTAVQLGSWRLGQDWRPFGIDPKTGYDPDHWAFVVRDHGVKNDYYPDDTQSTWWLKSGLTNTERVILTTDTKTGVSNAVGLTSADDVDDVIIPGSYYWYDSPPSNSPSPFPNYCTLEVVGVYASGDGSGIVNFVSQVVRDIDNAYVYERGRKSDGTFTAWKRKTAIPLSNGNFGSKTSVINGTGKFAGESSSTPPTRRSMWRREQRRPTRG